jgi:hypothetical protein
MLFFAASAEQELTAESGWLSTGGRVSGANDASLESRGAASGEVGSAAS